MPASDTCHTHTLAEAYTHSQQGKHTSPVSGQARRVCWDLALNVISESAKRAERERVEGT